MQNFSQRTLTFLIDKNKVLLGYKKSGFGSGNYLGIGGKVENAESNKQAAIREVKEEIEVEGLKLEKVADFIFLFPKKPLWSQQVHVYISRNWKNEPQETDEIRPEWIGFSELPFTHMWDDAQFWLSAILNGHSMKGTFTFNDNLKVTSLKLTEVDFKESID